jgi:DNA replication protein DnaC
MVSAGTGLMLSGPPGVGKTYAVIALTKAYDAMNEVEGRKCDYEFVTAPELFDRYANVVETGDRGYDEWRNQSYTKTYEQVPWLVINDLGKEYKGGALHEQVAYKLGRLLRARSERRKVTHLTTNLLLGGRGSTSDNTLENSYGPSILSLLREMVKAYEIVGNDRRKTTVEE